MAKVLKIIVASGAGTDAPARTINATRPKENLTMTSVNTVFATAFENNLLKIGTSVADRVREAYYEEVVRTPLTT